MSELVYWSVLYTGEDTPETVNLPDWYQFTPAAIPSAYPLELSWDPPLQSMYTQFWHSIAQIHWRWRFDTTGWSEDTYADFYFLDLPLVGYWQVSFVWGNDDGPAGQLIYTFDSTAFPWYLISTSLAESQDDFRDAVYSGGATRHVRVEGEQSPVGVYVYSRFFGPALTIPPAPPIPGGITQVGGAAGGVMGNAAIWQV